MNDFILKQFDNPDEIREFEKGKFEIVHMPNMTIGRATYKKGWKWSEDVTHLSGTKFCEVEHLGMVVEGQATAQFKNEPVLVIAFTSAKWLATEAVSFCIVLNLTRIKGFSYLPILSCLKRGEPVSIKVTKKMRTKIGDKRIKPISDKVKSNMRYIFYRCLFFDF